MKQISLLFLMPFFFTNLLAQKQGNIWYFGDHAGLNFNTTTPSALLNGQLDFPGGSSTHNEGSSSISDSTGALLFYTNGMTVWNRNHAVMLNGSGLLGNYSATQSSIIVPAPESPNRYFYIFTISSGFCCGSNVSDGLRYSKVDLCLDNTLGGIPQGLKNIRLTDSVAEKIAVTKHANKIDYWILIHKFNSNKFVAYKLTAGGITDTVISAIGAYHGGSISGSQGQLKFSPNGQKVAIGASNGADILELFDFNSSTGQLSNLRTLQKPNANHASIYGVEFSPDNSKLYASGLSSLGLFYVMIAQYDLNAGGGSLSAINASLTELIQVSTGLLSPKGLQLAPDQKIYWVSLANSMFLAKINQPNASGFLCDVQDTCVSLGGRNGSYSLPSFIAGYDYSNALNTCLQPNMLQNLPTATIQLYPNPSSHACLIELSHSPQKIKQIKILNNLGQTISDIRSVHSNSYLINTAHLINGNYMLCIYLDNELMMREKLLIQHD